MSNYRDSQTNGSAAMMNLGGETRASEQAPHHPTNHPLPVGWRRFPTGLRGARLFRVQPAGEGPVHWAVELKLDGKMVSRRFASELHARGWLSVATGPHVPALAIDRGELHDSFRHAALLHGG